MALDNLPPRLNPGDPPPTASWFNQLLQAIAAMRPVAGTGLRSSTSTQGTLLTAAQEPTNRERRTASPPGEEKYLSPFLTTRPTPQNPPPDYTPVPAWSITPGVINAMPPKTANGMVGDGDDPRKWAVPITTKGRIYAYAQTNSAYTRFLAPYEIRFAAGEPDSQLPAMGDTETAFAIGYVNSTPNPEPGKPPIWSVVSLNKYNLWCHSAGWLFGWGESRL